MSKKDNKKWFWHRVGPYCRHCGYDRSIRALHCHHLEKNVKTNPQDTLAMHIQASRESLVLWLMKTRFIILCANCHAELHDGIWRCPDDYCGDNVLFSKADLTSVAIIKLYNKILCHTLEEDQPSKHIKKIRIPDGYCV